MGGIKLFGISPKNIRGGFIPPQTYLYVGYTSNYSKIALNDNSTVFSYNTGISKVFSVSHGPNGESIVMGHTGIGDQGELIYYDADGNQQWVKSLVIDFSTNYRKAAVIEPTNSDVFVTTYDGRFKRLAANDGSEIYSTSIVDPNKPIHRIEYFNNEVIYNVHGQRARVDPSNGNLIQLATMTGNTVTYFMVNPSYVSYWSNDGSDNLESSDGLNIDLDNSSTSDVRYFKLLSGGGAIVLTDNGKFFKLSSDETTSTYLNTVSGASVLAVDNSNQKIYVGPDSNNDIQVFDFSGNNLNTITGSFGGITEMEVTNERPTYW